MKKIYILFFIFSIFILFSSKNVNAQVTQTCGDPYGTGAAKKCCNANTNVTIDPTINQAIHDKGCVGPICPPNLSDALKSAQGFLSKDILKQLPPVIACYNGSQPSKDPSDPNCECNIVPVVLSSKYCDLYIANNNPPTSLTGAKRKEYTDCDNCFKAQGFWTGLGCFYMMDWKTFVEKNIFGVSLGFAGMIALLCIIYSAFIYQTSQGNPEKIKGAQERLTSCILGLLLIIFSIFILRLIGVNILGLPGLK